MVLFFDSSALVKRYLREAGTSLVVEWIRSDHNIAVSQLAHVEVAATIARRRRAGDIEEDHAIAALEALEEELRIRFDVTNIHPPILIRAVDLVKVHALRAADAIQLACLFTAAGGTRSSTEITFVCSDVALSTAAKEEGFTVLDPQDE